MKRLIPTLTIALIASLIHAREYHVALDGTDMNEGSASKPLKTISAAAAAAQPGDIIIVHEGTYRERINPPRGGTSDRNRITYQAAKDEKVSIKGSEIATGWTRVESGVWKITRPNSFFGNYNPYKDVITGDWFHRKDRDHHTGEVYLNGKALFEEVSLDKVKQKKLSWYCQTDDKNTYIWANFTDQEPNKEQVEINARPAVFYPDKPGRNYITVRGFIMRHAATQWAAPTAEQIALIGVHWSKGWIIENNVISDSKCVGITLGKDRSSGHNNAESAGGYNNVVKLALEAGGWSKKNIGSHIIRNNTIHDCGAAGICGSMGAIFSQITGNHIYNINQKKPFSGYEQAGIKFHAPIDVLIKNNRIHDTNKGIWLDWMTQGTRVTANLLYNNPQDLFLEVNHGPFVIDNNLFLSGNNITEWSEGGAYAHNLFRGSINGPTKAGRQTPYHKAHSTEIKGLSSIKGGDNRFHNNIVTSNGLNRYNNAESPMLVNGNVYLKKAKPFKGETDFVNEAEFNPQIEIIEEGNAIYLSLVLPECLTDQKNQLVKTELLGKARVTGAKFENPDGSPLTIDSDYFGKKRNKQNPSAGPFENPEKESLKLKVWPLHTAR